MRKGNYHYGEKNPNWKGDNNLTTKKISEILNKSNSSLRHKASREHLKKMKGGNKNDKI